MSENERRDLISTVRLSALWMLLLTGAAFETMADPTAHSPQNEDDVAVAADIDGRLRTVRASIEIHASSEKVWRTLTNCSDALKFVPGLINCTVLRRAADDSWQSVRHVVHYTWFMPTLTYVFRADLKAPLRVGFERTSGDLRSLKGNWTLRRDGVGTQVICQAQTELGFWIPQWVVSLAVKRELPKMMRKLRELSETG